MTTPALARLENKTKADLTADKKKGRLRKSPPVYG